MPEGPSLIILKDALQPFIGKQIKAARGNASIDMDLFPRKKILDIRTWGKHLIISFNDFSIRIHFLMFGTYSFDEQTKPDRSLRLALQSGKRSVYFYTCSVKMLEKDPDQLYDWESDVMSEHWSASKARKKLKKMMGSMVCDVLLDQEVFSGVGNIIKNEVLYRIHVHPESRISKIPSRKLTALIREARNYCFDFLKWKKDFVLKKNWLVHTKKICATCNGAIKKKYCGVTDRRSFFCPNCQFLYK